jgi:predicted membrane-bound spermidine synthase
MIMQEPSVIRKIIAIVLLEGFVTISAEILTIRQLMAFVGNSVVVTSLIIGVFLLFLAYGYRAGGRLGQGHASRLMRNFLGASLLLGLGLSYFFIYTWFDAWKPYAAGNLYFPLLSYLFVVTAPLVYLLGQTVPLTLHLFPEAEAIKAGRLGGRILHLNTLGSFLGAVLTSVILFNYLGVAWTVAINTAILVCLALCLVDKKQLALVSLGGCFLVFPLTYLLNVRLEQVYFLKTNHYANYRVVHYTSPDLTARQFEINHSYSSFLDSQDRAFPYIDKIREILFGDLKLEGKEILILGAGGFTLSRGLEQNNHFVYVDIDPAILPLSEAHFSGPVEGEFIAQDARSFLQTTPRKFDAVVMDTYSNAMSIPQHLLTKEYFDSLIQVLKPEGLVIVNRIANPQFADRDARRFDATLRSVMGFCTSAPEKYENGLTNLVYVCYPVHRNEHEIYTDNFR